MTSPEMSSVRRRARQAASRDVRRARRFGCTVVALSPDRYVALYAAPCSYCGLSPANGIDHATPLIRGGAHSEANVVPCCLPCNRAKGKRTRAEFRWNRGVGVVAVTRGKVIPATVVEVVKRAYRELGWTQHAMARALEVSPSTVGRWVHAPSGRRSR